MKTQTIGKKIIVDGETFYSPDYYSNGLSFGTFFKDEDAFLNNTSEVCYIPEAYFAEEEPSFEENGREYYAVDGYSRHDLEMLIENEIDEDGEKIEIGYFFSILLWACPETHLNEIAY